MNDVIEGPPVGPADRGERPAGRVPERDQERAGSIRRQAEQLPGHVLVADGRMTAADSQAGRGQHDAHRRLAKIELGASMLAVVSGGDQRDRRGGARHMSAAPPHRGQLLQLIAVGYDDEVPGLGVLRRWRPAASLKHLLELLRGDRPVGELPDVAPRRDRGPDAHLPAADRVLPRTLALIAHHKLLDRRPVRLPRAWHMLSEVEVPPYRLQPSGCPIASGRGRPGGKSWNEIDVPLCRKQPSGCPIASVRGRRGGWWWWWPGPWLAAARAG